MASSIRIPLPLRTALFAALLASWCSGLVFFILNQWVMVEGPFGPQKHPWQSIFLKVHGGAAFLMMIAYGYLLASHVPASWRARRMRRVGLTLVIGQGFLIVSAYLLYYIAADTFRTYLAYAHASVGFLFPFLLALHLLQGKQRRTRKAGPVSQS